MKRRQERIQAGRTMVVLISASCIALLLACETRKDPFAAKNTAPQITSFFFRPDTLPNIGADSLKFRPGTSYRLHLEYNDPEFAGSETQQLEARFKFILGSGQFTHDRFQPIEGDRLRFRVPGTFNDDVLFTPATAGLIHIELVLSDGVKDSDPPGRASAVFFENLAPIPVFTAQALTQVNPYRFAFDPSNSHDRDGKIRQFIWRFGDDSDPQTVQSNSVITHEYALAGQYRVLLKIVDNEGKADSTEQVITTNNQPPVAALRVIPEAGQAPLEIDYNAGSSFDPDGTIASYQITFDDGETAQQAAGKHTYQRDGDYRVLLVVRDNLGLADSTARQVQVSTPPVAVLKVSPLAGTFPLQVTIDASESHDPFGGDLRYEIFIDGQLFYTQSKVMHTFVTPKVSAYLIRLEVTSSRTGLRSIANEAVQVKNTPPVADFTFTPPNPQATVQILFNSTSIDPDSTDTITNYRWIWGDGTEDSGAGLQSVIHQYNVTRTYTVKLIVTDRFGATGEKEKTVVVQ